MSKRTYFTVITPLPPSVSREAVMETLHNHYDMIDLNPLVIGRVSCEAPDHATDEERNCRWYTITDKISYLPGGLAEGNISYDASFHDLHDGLQTHVFAPMGVNIKGRWTLGGSLPGEPKETSELGLGIPKEGLYLREDVDLRCNMLMMAFIKKDLKKSHEELVQRLIQKAIEKDKASGRPARPARPEEPLPPAYGAQSSTDQKPSSSQRQSGSYYAPDTKSAPQNPLQNSGYAQSGQPSGSQQSLQSSSGRPPLSQHSSHSQQSFSHRPNQASQTSNYPYPQGPHQQSQLYQQQPPCQSHQGQSQPQRYAAELDSSDPSLIPQPLRPDPRSGSPYKPAEMQG